MIEEPHKWSFENPIFTYVVGAIGTMLLILYLLIMTHIAF